jgi:ribonuclease-3
MTACPDDPDLAETLAAVAAALGHRFANPELLKQGCTHASGADANLPAGERRRATNERMEFLGDALLGAAVAFQLYRGHPDESEGTLSAAKSQLVSRETLARGIERLDLVRHCRYGEVLPDPLPDKVKADLAEGILGAIFLDAGWEPLRTAVGRLLGDELDADPGDRRRADAKSRLQELCLDRFAVLPTYSSVRSGGTDHAPEFTCTVTVAEHTATASGTSRRRSEAAAATELLRRLIEVAD